MSDDTEGFLAKLRATFRAEARENVEAISAGVLALESASGGERDTILERIFREAHSLKGAARAVNLSEVERICHALESLLAGWKQRGSGWDAPRIDLVLKTVDAVARMAEGAEPEVPAKELIDRLEAAAAGRPAGRRIPDRANRAPSSPPAKPPAPAPEPKAAPATIAGATVRVATSRLDAILRGTEELLGPRLAAAQRVREIRELRAEVASSRRSDGGPALVSDGERVLDDRLARLEKAAESDRRRLDSLVESLLENVKETQMLPFSSLLEGSRRTVRDLSREQGKEVELEIGGAEIEVDRRILDELRAPFAHLLRNAIDHGIENPDVRETMGKRRAGTIRIGVTHRAGRVEIAVHDDGRGIDVGALREAAERMGAVPSEALALLDDAEALQLVFQSGLSTSAEITELSGRGLGLPIVREKVERLGGTVRIESTSGAGSTFRIVLPMTLATIHGVLVKAADRMVVIPSSGIERVARIAAAEIRTVERREAIFVDGRPVPIARLANALELAERVEPPDPTPVVILSAGSSRVGVAVDAVVAEQEVLVKPLGPQLARVRNVAGAAVLGSGEVVPVLAVADLALASMSVAPAASPSPVARQDRIVSILVAEDSITSRVLLQQILETAGYEVAVAVDGREAWTLLREREFDLVVSDIEMPRMDGFELTEKIRADAALASLPVVLVTALDSAEDRERGLDAGASAYLVKSRFDQSNLLEVVRRLV